MNLQEANIFLKTALADLYDSRELTTISDWVLEKITSLPRIDRLMQRDQQLSEIQERRMKVCLDQLLANKPVQYVLEEAHFYGLIFYVDENVLIPRPETEELVEWILQDTNNQAYSVLDIGTGSGCIPISLKSKNNKLILAGCDISKGALSVARRNADVNRVDVDLFYCDITDQNQSANLPVYDIIVSNPPYIPEEGKKAMSPNVLRYEPHQALFTPDNDPYLFYRTIAMLGRNKLGKKGKLYFEIHEEGSVGVINILEEQGYTNIRLRNDLFNRPRMIRAEK
ncbi:MAG: peptide chain release factor N(5)-glutamine methyltransferase [Chitinophagaceae bacterium]|nr:MAG: peptide chain release factor N(5)-glutamine methyltransferase [Chitinophagaceae bacterium]